ncbi:MAG: glycosyl hydrolase 53 family protein, partial [Lachnospiraceae bacterium]|nr:glycosyl hydrolase 53 family protein [Lachnospiraceae bacterium]
WFDAYLAQGGEDFDVIGLSYYPFWHGTMEDLRTNLTDLAKRYHKPMMIVETAMAFTYEEYQLKEEPDGMIWGSEGSAAGEVQTGQNGGDQKKHLAERAGQIEQKAADQQKPLAAGAELGKDLPWPGTPQGQIEFLRDLARVIREIPEELCKGFIWWEPAWIPVQGSGWATPAALEYLHDKGPGGNEWANQALFDYRGNALPALKQLEAL